MKGEELGKALKEKKSRRRKKRFRRLLGLFALMLILLFCKDMVIEALNLNRWSSRSAITVDGILLVNDSYRLESGYAPENLVEVDIPFVEEADREERLLSPEVAEATKSLFQEASKEGIMLLATSGYRSYESQSSIFKREVISRGKKTAEEYVALPGASEHQTGLCIDITNEARWMVKGTAEAEWLEANCHKFGFILRYPEGKEEITGKSYEPWHIRYVGNKAAKEIYERGIALEEYLNKR